MRETHWRNTLCKRYFLTSGSSRAVELPASDLLLLATPIHLLKRPGLYPIGGSNRAIKPICICLHCLHCLHCLLCILNFAGATISLTAVLPLFSSEEPIPVCLPPKGQVLHAARIRKVLKMQRGRITDDDMLSHPQAALRTCPRPALAHIPWNPQTTSNNFNESQGFPCGFLDWINRNTNSSLTGQIQSSAA